MGSRNPHRILFPPDILRNIVVRYGIQFGEVPLRPRPSMFMRSESTADRLKQVFAMQFGIEDAVSVALSLGTRIF